MLSFTVTNCYIRMHIPILIRMQNGRIGRWENGHLLLKNVLLKFIFQDEGHFYANCLFRILAIKRKCLLFHFLSRVIRIHVPILTQVQNGCINCWENSHILIKKMYFQKFIFEPAKGEFRQSFLTCRAKILRRSKMSSFHINLKYNDWLKEAMILPAKRFYWEYPSYL